MIIRKTKRYLAVVGLGAALGAFLLGSFHAHQARPELSGGQGCELCLLHGGTPALTTAAVVDPQSDLIASRVAPPSSPVLAAVLVPRARPRAPPHT